MAKKQYLIKNVEVKYPRLNQPYHWDSKIGKTVPCGALDDNAAYTSNFVMDESVAEPLYQEMDEAYAQQRKSNWPKELGDPTEVFTETDDGRYEYKVKFPAAYNGQATRKPIHFDAKMDVLPNDFELTMGSIVNFVVELIPYKLNNHGVSLRLRQVQVLQLAEQTQRASDLLQAEDGYTFDKPKFGVKTDVADQLPDIEEEVEEPKKVVSMKKEKAAAPISESDMKGLVNKWGQKKKVD